MKKILLYISFFCLLTVTISAENPEKNEGFDLYSFQPSDYIIMFEQSKFYITDDAFGYMHFGTYELFQDTIITHSKLELVGTPSEVGFTYYEASPVYDKYLILSDSVIVHYHQIPESWIKEYNDPETDEIIKAVYPPLIKRIEELREMRIQYVKAVPIKE